MTPLVCEIGRPGRGLLAVALALLAACSPEPREEPQAAVARAAVALRDGRFEEALGLARDIERRGDAPATVVAVTQDLRLIAVAGLRRSDELQATARELGDLRGGLAMVLAARAGLAWVAAGGRVDELEPLFAQVDRSNPFDGKRLRQEFAAREQRLATGGAVDGAECLFCRQPGCDMACVQQITCEFCPPKPTP